MQPHRIILTGLILVCSLLATAPCLAQDDHVKTQIVYTGKLMGYFRSPSHQPRDNTRGCSKDPKANSDAANKFQVLRQVTPDAVLVGAGDNFAPELEGRIFETPKDYTLPANKELYYWYEKGHEWVYFTQLDNYPDLRAQLALGRATIPTDNVGCFLAAAKFAAVVPGKHDFYFGPERVRELARFMATLTADDMKGYGFDKDKYHPPQMLGANLVIKTSQIAPPSPVKSEPKSKWPDESSIKNLGDGTSVYPWFSSVVRVQVPFPSPVWIKEEVQKKFRIDEYAKQVDFDRFLTQKIDGSVGDEKKAWIALQKAVGQQTAFWICPPQEKAKALCEGGWNIGKSDFSTMVPASETLRDELNAWFMLKRQFDRDEFESFLKAKSDQPNDKDKDAWQKLYKGVRSAKDSSIKVCPTNERNEVLAGCKPGWQVQGVSLLQDDNGINYSIKLLPKPGDLSKYTPMPILEPGWNYGLCQVEKDSVKDGLETRCQTFSVLSPFFSFSRVVPSEGKDYKDPDPFVFIKSPTQEVAIFGVVDPSITQRIGVLNYSWANEDKKLKTAVSAEDPAEALKEQLDYFDSWYESTHPNQKFSGLKILLAQMSPQQAKLLAARLNKFQMVVTEADEEQATSEAMLTTEWSSTASASAFVAVPAPYYKAGPINNVEGNLHYGMVEARKIDGTDKWKLQSNQGQALDVAGKFKSPDDLAQQIRPLLKNCVRSEFADDDKRYPMEPGDIIKLAALCAMRERLGADVALIQKRDLFPRVPDVDTTNIQQLLDRLIWKGDFLTLMYVPGSALKKALDLSKKYDGEDSDNLSLSDEKGRGLQYLGIKKNDNGDYLVNEVPLDDNKVYAVATTDFIGGGDTGYPDLAAAALNPKTRAGQLPDKLELISAVVCRKFHKDFNSQCVDEISRQEYVDEIADAPPFTPKPGFASKLKYLNPFKAPDKSPWKDNVSDALDQRVQQRKIWMLSLKNFSVAFNGLNNNDTDDSIDNKYGGIVTSGVNTHENHSIVVGLDLRGVRSKHKYDLFGATSIDYNTKSSDTSSDAPSVAQNSNRLTGDLGVLWNAWGGRSSVRVGPIFTLHAETQLAQPFTMFKLSTSSPDAGGRSLKDHLKVSPGRSVPVLARAGVKSQNRTNEFEFGFERGREFNVLTGYQFVTNGMSEPVKCNLDATTSISDCIKTGISNGTITKDSVVSSFHQDRPRNGVYWKWNISIPFHPKVKFELSDEGDFYFADPGHDILTETRFRDLSKSSLKFTIFPNFTIGPHLDLLLYRNQTGLNAKGEQSGGDFLSQKTFGLEATFSFNWFNRREPGVQFKSKP